MIVPHGAQCDRHRPSECKLTVWTLFLWCRSEVFPLLLLLLCVVAIWRQHNSIFHPVRGHIPVPFPLASLSQSQRIIRIVIRGSPNKQKKKKNSSWKKRAKQSYLLSKDCASSHQLSTPPLRKNTNKTFLTCLTPPSEEEEEEDRFSTNERYFSFSCLCFFLVVFLALWPSFGEACATTNAVRRKGWVRRTQPKREKKKKHRTVIQKQKIGKNFENGWRPKRNYFS